MNKSNAKKKKVLFICTHNSARSQMAEAFLNKLYGDSFEALSAGTEPADINPNAVEVMKEIGIDMNSHYSKSLNEFSGKKFDYIVTVCDKTKEKCPFFPGNAVHIHRGFENPAGYSGTKDEILDKFRKTRDEIKQWIEKQFAQGG